MPNIHYAGDVGSDVSSPVAVTAAATTNLDMSTGNYFRVAMGLSVTTLAIINPPPVSSPTRLKLAILQDATGTRTITNWPANMRFTGAANPTLTATASRQDFFTFVWDPTALLWLEDTVLLNVPTA